MEPKPHPNQNRSSSSTVQHPRTHGNPHWTPRRPEPGLSRTGRTEALNPQFSSRSPERNHDVTSSKLPGNKEPGAEPDRSAGRTRRTGTDCGASRSSSGHGRNQNPEVRRSSSPSVGGGKTFSGSGPGGLRNRTAESGPGWDGTEPEGLGAAALCLTEGAELLPAARGRAQARARQSARALCA